MANYAWSTWTDTQILYVRKEIYSNCVKNFTGHPTNLVEWAIRWLGFVYSWSEVHVMSVILEIRTERCEPNKIGFVTSFLLKTGAETASETWRIKGTMDRIVPGLSRDPPRHRIYRGGRGDGDNREDTPNRSYRKQLLLLKSNHLMFSRAHTYTSCSLSWYFRSVPWIRLSPQTSVTLLASWHPFCNMIPAHLQQRLLSGEPTAGTAEWAEWTLTCRRKPQKILYEFLNKNATSQESLFLGSNLERAASIYYWHI